MKKVFFFIVLLSALSFLPFSMEASAESNTKKYTISTDSKPSKAYTKLDSYNKYTRYYYVFKEILKDCEKNGGGKITVKKGTYTITNVLCIPSNVTLILEDGVVIKKGDKTGTSELTPTKSIFQLIKPSKLSSSKYYEQYKGEKNISIIGKGNATIDLDYMQNSIGFVLGHNQKVSITGLTFKNLNSGHFIEMDASKDVSITNCSFLESKESPKHNKEAINIDTPDALTGGFNSIWSARDKTPNMNVTIDKCIFKNIDCAVGTHRYSQKQNAQGAFYENIYHSNIKITNSKFYGIRNYVFDVINWEDVEISNCEISGGSYMKERVVSMENGVANTQLVEQHNMVLRLKGVRNFKFINNTCDNIGSIAATSYITPTPGDYNASYIDLEFKLSVENVKDLIFNNTYRNVKYNLISTCPLKSGSIIDDPSYSKYLKYGTSTLPSDYVSIFVGLDYMTLTEAREKEKNQ